MFTGYNTIMKQRIRKGGVQTARGFLFELTGGDVSLDFANTVDLRPTRQPRELIPRYEDLLSWGRQARLLSTGKIATLRKMAKRNPAGAIAAHRRAIEAREVLFQIFAHLAEGKRVSRRVLSKWNRILPQSIAHYEMVADQHGFTWTLRPENLQFDSLLWPVIHSAIQLLTGPNASRIRMCAGANCNWVFLDESKRGNRRWCDMTVCGNRAKARAFYTRKKHQS